MGRCFFQVSARNPTGFPPRNKLQIIFQELHVFIIPARRRRRLRAAAPSAIIRAVRDLRQRISTARAARQRPPHLARKSTAEPHFERGKQMPVIRRETIHRMTRRRNGWDYRAPGRYMVTLTLADRSSPWLGTLEEAVVPRIAPTALGTLVAAKWRELPALFPGVEVEEFVVMPDHLHGILHLATRQKHPLGQIVGSFKARSTGAARELAGKPAGEPWSKLPGTMVPGSLLHGSSLWAEGLADSILYSEERRHRAVAYIADNARRLAEKRLHPELFTVRRDLAVPLPLSAGEPSPIGPDSAGELTRRIVCHFSAIGNEHLLRRLDFHQVQCSRRYFAYRRDPYGNPLPDEPPARKTPEFELASKLADTMAAAGAVLVCPCISHGEREIARRCFEAGCAMIVLKNKGFSPLYKPEGAYFDRCAEGRLLLLAPAAWPYTPGKKPMTRLDACALNRIAQAITESGGETRGQAREHYSAGEPGPDGPDSARELARGSKELARRYHGMTPANIDALARAAVLAAPPQEATP